MIYKQENSLSARQNEGCGGFGEFIGFTNNKILVPLVHQQQIILSARTMKRLCKKLHFYTKQNHTDLEERHSLVEYEIASSGRQQIYP